ncbi:hypothetical protein PMM47T1_09356 [Pseudomonas sp. M47T1]|nr:hypothetical protein PMM47T1_09356 [Pseudomonas sp. M47T1]
MVLAAFGLGALADDILKGLPPIIDAYVRGISMAWNGPKEDWPIESGFVGGGDFGPARLAAWQIASAHETVVLLILGALVSYLTRGRGDINVLARQMRGSERGSRLAQWMIKHEDHLKRRPDLKPPEPRRGALVDPPEHGPQREKRSGRGKAPTMPLHHVECFKADKLPASKIGEFERQLGGQERGLNRLTVQEYLENVANPIKRNKRAAAIARADFEEKLRHRFQKEFSFMLDPVAAKRKAIEDARNTMSNLAGLHNPDLRAGGRDIVSDFGDRQVNSSIGPQWRPKIDNLKKSSGECAALFARIDFYKC